MPGLSGVAGTSVRVHKTLHAHDIVPLRGKLDGHLARRESERAGIGCGRALLGGWDA